MPRPAEQRAAWLEAVRSPLAAKDPESFLVSSEADRNKRAKQQGKKHLFKHLFHGSMDFILLNPHKILSSLLQMMI